MKRMSPYPILGEDRARHYAGAHARPRGRPPKEYPFATRGPAALVQAHLRTQR